MTTTMGIKGTVVGLAVAAAFSLALASAASAADTHCPPGLPAGIVCGTPDYRLAPAGDYAIDAQHTGVVARVSHIGYSYSIFRFGDVKGALKWDPASPELSTLTVTVKTASIATPVPNFAAELAGPQFLNSAAFPDATFTSVHFHQTGKNKGHVDGNFTLHGVTKPLALDVELVGAGPGFGAPRMGVHASGAINPADFGLSPMLGSQILLTIDTEFAKG